MTINHVEITDPNIHESKGVAGAGAGEVAVTDGGGGASHRKLTVADLDVSSALEGSTLFADGGVSVFRNLVRADLDGVQLCSCDLLRSKATADQEISVEGDVVQLNFGPAGDSLNGHVSLAADGTVTFNTDGFYPIYVNGVAGRTTSVSTAVLMLLAEFSGVSLGTQASSIGAASDILAPQSGVFHVQASAGDTFKIFMLADILPSGNLGLYGYTPVNGGVEWLETPSAEITVTLLGLEDV